MRLFRAILAALGGGLKVAGEWMEAKGRAEDQKAGAAKQREADQREELERTREQLDEAVNHRPDRWRDDAGEGRF